MRFTANVRFKVLPDGRLRLPKVGDVEIRWSRRLPSAPSSVTVIKDAAGRYFASFVVETDPAIDAQRFPVAKGEVGISRRNFQHQVSTRIVRDSQAVYVEDLCGGAEPDAAGEVRTRRWGSAFTAMLEYKSARYGRVFVRTGRFEPTSQMCSACGVKDGPKPVKVRRWMCAACGIVHDRDVNAAKNVLALGRRERLNACGGDVRQGSALAVAGEAGTHPGAA